MPICKSKLNFDKIKLILKEKYDLNCYKIQAIANCSANVFVIFSDNNQKYILKEFQDNFDVSKIEREILIINYLGKTDVPVPVFLKTIDKNFFLITKQIIYIYKNILMVNQKNFIHLVVFNKRKLHYIIVKL